MVRLLVYYAAWNLDRNHHMEVSDKVSMANYRANRLVCDAAVRTHLPSSPPLPDH